MALAQKKSIIKDKKIIIGYLTILLFFLLLTLVQINKPIRGEQDFFAYGAHKLADGEKPEFSFTGYHKEKMSALAHPPLYLYSMALFVKIFGYNLFALKFSGILFTILTSFILFMIAKGMFQKNSHLPVIAVFLYLVNPLTIQSTLMLDMDGGILTFLTVSTIFCFMKYRLSRPFLLGFIIFLCLWVKTTSFVIISLGLFIFIVFFDNEDKIISKEKAKKVFKLIALFTISLIIFLISYYVYAFLIGMDSTEFIKHNLLQKFENRDLANVLLRAGGGIKTFIIWVNPVVSLFLGFIFLRDFKKIIKKELDKSQIIVYIIIITAIIFFAVTGVAVSGIGKYFAFLVPLISLLLALEISKIKFSRKLIVAALVISIVIIEYYLLFLGDPIYTREIWMVFSQFNISLVLSVTLKILIILLPLPLLYFVFKRDLMVSMIILIFIFSIYSATYTSFVKYSTNNNYGDYGIEEVVQYLHKLTEDKNATIIAERGVAYLWDNGNYLDEKNNNAYVYVAQEYYLYGKKFFNDSVVVPNNTYLVIYEQNLYRILGFKENLKENFEFLNKMRYYQIYKAKQG